MKVSVIIPVYNSGKYLKRCLDSIRSQDFEDFEVILVNDGSTDDSCKICEQYSSIDDRFRVITQGNSGPDMARKAGVSLAIGDYIMLHPTC